MRIKRHPPFRCGKPTKLTNPRRFPFALRQTRTLGLAESSGHGSGIAALFAFCVLLSRLTLAAHRRIPLEFFWNLSTAEAVPCQMPSVFAMPSVKRRGLYSALLLVKDCVLLMGDVQESVFLLLALLTGFRGGASSLGCSPFSRQYSSYFCRRCFRITSLPCTTASGAS